MGDQAITLSNEHRSNKTEDSFSSLNEMSISELEALFRAHHREVYLAAYRVCGSTHDAEDVLQSVFMRLLKRSEQQNEGMDDGQTHKEDRLNLGYNPANYLCRAAINASLDIIRGKQRNKVVNIEDHAEQIGDGASADRDIRSHQQRRHLRMALSRLNQHAAEVFSLRYFQDFSNAEIATVLNTSSSSIAVTLHRARNQLQEFLREYEGG